MLIDAETLLHVHSFGSRSLGALICGCACPKTFGVLAGTSGSTLEALCGCVIPRPGQACPTFTSLVECGDFFLAFAARGFVCSLPERMLGHRSIDRHLPC